MKTLLKDNTATNAMEAKVITDNFLSSLSDLDCFRLMGGSLDECYFGTMSLRVSYAIGASAYYYGSECKIFCSDHLQYTIFNRGMNYVKNHPDYKKQMKNALH